MVTGPSRERAPVPREAPAGRVREMLPGRFPPSSFPIRELSPGGVYPKHQSQPGLFLFLWTMALPGKGGRRRDDPRPPATAPAQQPSCCPFPALTRPQQPPGSPGSPGDGSSSLAGNQSFVYCSQSKPVLLPAVRSIF